MCHIVYTRSIPYQECIITVLSFSCACNGDMFKFWWIFAVFLVVVQKSALRSYPVCLGEDLMHLTQPREGHPLIVISVHPQQQAFVSCFLCMPLHTSHNVAGSVV